MEKSQIAFEKLGIVTKTQIIDKIKYQYAEYENMNQLKDQIKMGYELAIFPNYKADQFGHNGNEPSGGNGWTFGYSYKNIEEVERHMEFGLSNQRTLEFIEEYKETLLNKESIKELQYTAKTLKKRRVFSEVGSELDIDRVLCGDPEHWSNMKQGAEKKVMKLGFNIGMRESVREEEIQKITALGIVAAEIIGGVGISTEVYACYLGCNRTTKVKWGGLMVKVKSADEKLDIQRLSGVAISGIYRTFGFSTIDCVLDGGDCGFGSSGQLNQNMIDMTGLDYIIDNNATPGEMEIIVGELINPTKKN